MLSHCLKRVLNRVVNRVASRTGAEKPLSYLLCEADCLTVNDLAHLFS